MATILVRPPFDYSLALLEIDVEGKYLAVAHNFYAIAPDLEVGIPDFDAHLTQGHVFDFVIAPAIRRREKRVIFHHNEGFHIRMGVTENARNAGLVEFLTSTLS